MMNAQTIRESSGRVRHPPPTSLDCAQCHQAPPSHYMMHFKMTTASVEKAEVNQCFLCHQTTSWIDIKGVGFYKHHKMKDPICGMTVNPDNALHAERDGQTHYSDCVSLSGALA